MVALTTLCIIAAVLFITAFISKRRFGILGLALTAGAAVSDIWKYDATLVIASTGILPKGPLAEALVPSLIILLPAIVLFFTGYKYKSIFGRIVGSLLFTLLALAFLVTPLGVTLPIDGTGAQVYNFLLNNKEIIIGAGVVCAVIDLFLRRSPHPVEQSGKKHH